MDTKFFIEQCLAATQSLLLKTLDGLTPDDLAWKPREECNSIGFLLWHMLRTEDIMIQRFAQRKQEIYEAEGWSAKLGTPPGETGYNYSLEQMTKFTVPKLEDLLAYGKSVSEHTLIYLRSLTAEKFDEKVRPNRTETIGEIFGTVVAHLNQHVGQISYLRGLQKGLNK